MSIETTPTAAEAAEDPRVARALSRRRWPQRPRGSGGRSAPRRSAHPGADVAVATLR